MSGNEWPQERIDRWRSGAKTKYPTARIGRADFLSLLDALERARAERDIVKRDAAFLLEVAEFAEDEPAIIGTNTWKGACDGVRRHAREVPR